MAQLTDETPSIAAYVGEILDLVFDFGNVPEIRAGGTLSSPSVPAVSGITIASVAVTTVDKEGVPAGQGVQCLLTMTATGTYTVNAYANISNGAKRRRGVKIVVF